MSLNFEELAIKLKNCGVVHPSKLISNSYKYPVRTVVPSSVRVDKETIAAIFIMCPKTDMDYFQIKIPVPQPDLKFRFLEMNTCPVIEIMLRFDKNRQLVMHLNPSATCVKKLLDGCIKTGVISFNYLCSENKMLASSFTGLDEEQIEWIIRTYHRSLNIETTPDSVFDLTSESIALKFKPNHKYYKFFESKTSSFTRLLELIK